MYRRSQKKIDKDLSVEKLINFFRKSSKEYNDYINVDVDSDDWPDEPITVKPYSSQNSSHRTESVILPSLYRDTSGVDAFDDNRVIEFKPK